MMPSTRALPQLTLLALLLLVPACRHRAGNDAPRYSHEEAQPVSSLPHNEFSQVSPQRGRR